MNSGQQLHTRKTKVNDIWDCELIRLSLSRMESDMVSGKSWGLVMCHPVAEPHSSSCPNHVDRVYTSSYVHQSSLIQRKLKSPVPPHQQNHILPVKSHPSTLANQRPTFVQSSQSQLNLKLHLFFSLSASIPCIFYFLVF